MKASNKALGSDVSLINSEFGDVVGRGYFKTEEIAVANWVMTDGALLGEHIHKGISEHLFAYKGEVTFRINDKEVTINKNTGLFTIPPDTPHEVIKTVGLTSMIALTMPADEGYPDARTK